MVDLSAVRNSVFESAISRDAALASLLAQTDLITNEELRTEALIGLIPHLSSALAGKVIFRAETVSNERLRSEVLSALAPQLSLEQIADALEVAHRIVDRVPRTIAIASLSKYLPQALREALLDGALAGIDDLSAEERALLLSILLPQLSNAARVKAARETLLDIQSIPSGVRRARYLYASIKYIPEPLLEQALTDTIHVEDDLARSRALSILIPYLPKTSLPRVLAVALEIIGTAHLEAPRFHVDSRDFRERATFIQARMDASVDAGLDGFDPRPEMMGILVQRLTPAERKRALHKVLQANKAAKPSQLQAQILVTLAPYVPTAMLPEVIAHAKANTLDLSRVEALLAFIEHLAADEKEALVAEALDTIKTNDITFQHVRVWTALIPHLSKATCEAASRGILAAAKEHSLCASVLRGLAPNLPEGLLPEAFNDALNAPFNHDGIDTVAALAQRLSEAQRSKILAGLRKNSSSPFRAEVMVAIAPYLTGSLVGQAVTVANEIANDWYRTRALIALVPHIPAKEVANPNPAAGRPSKLLERSEQTAPGLYRNAAAHFDLALSWLETGKTAEAIAEFKRALELFPGISDPIAILGKLEESLTASKVAIEYDSTIYYDNPVMENNEKKPGELATAASSLPAAAEELFRLPPSFQVDTYTKSDFPDDWFGNRAVVEAAQRFVNACNYRRTKGVTLEPSEMDRKRAADRFLKAYYRRGKRKELNA